jgi:hypothetical protein
MVKFHVTNIVQSYRFYDLFYFSVDYIVAVILGSFCRLAHSAEFVLYMFDEFVSRIHPLRYLPNSSR